MTKRGDLVCIKDIQEAIRRIQKYTKEVTRRKFLQDTEKQDAVVRNFEIIGEATKNISSNIKRKHKDITWK